MISPLVYVIIPYWNGKQWIDACLQSLIKTKYASFKIVLVDNGSTDGSIPHIEKCFPEVSIIANGRNQGFAVACNVGMKYAFKQKADYIVLLNQDTKVAPSWLDGLVEIARQNPDIGFLSPMQFDYHGQQLEGTFKDLMTRNSQFARDLKNENLKAWYSVSALMGATMMMTRSAVDRVGYFDSLYFMYYEEMDLCRRALLSGFKLAVVTQSTIYHWNSGAHPDQVDRRSKYYGYRNRFVYILKDPRNRLINNLCIYLKASFTQRHIFSSRSAYIKYMLSIHIDILYHLPVIAQRHTHERNRMLKEMPQAPATTHAPT